MKKAPQPSVFFLLDGLDSVSSASPSPEGPPIAVNLSALIHSKRPTLRPTVVTMQALSFCSRTGKTIDDLDCAKQTLLLRPSECLRAFLANDSNANVGPNPVFQPGVSLRLLKSDISRC